MRRYTEDRAYAEIEQALRTMFLSVRAWRQ